MTKLVSKEWPALKEIRLGWNDLGDEGLAILFSRGPKQIEEL